jgi:sugar O-acyltransferase (sialic acid O-acetyltransferase NeuD family)
LPSRRPIIIFGIGELAEVAHYYFSHDSEREIAGFSVDAAYRNNESFCGLPVATLEELRDRWPPSAYEAFVAIGYSKLNALRAAKIADFRTLGYSLASYISTKMVHWPGVSYGENCFVLEDNTIQPFVRIGSGVVLWSGNHIGHHSIIEDNCFVTSHAVISGGVTVGERSFIGVNATIRDHVRIGQRNLIGAGSLITGDTPDDAVFTAPKAEMSAVPSSRIRHI